MLLRVTIIIIGLQPMIHYFACRTLIAYTHFVQKLRTKGKHNFSLNVKLSIDVVVELMYLVSVITMDFSGWSLFNDHRGH